MSIGAKLLDFVINVLAGLFGDPRTVPGMIAWGIIAIFGIIGLVRWNRRQRAGNSPGMGSWPFIAACIIVALSASGAAVYGLALKFSSAEPGASAQHSDKPLLPRLTQYDVSRRLKIIDDILDYLDTKVMPLNPGVEQLGKNIFQRIHERTAIEALGTQASALTQMRTEYYTLIGRYMNFPDIYGPAFDTTKDNTWEPEQLVNSSSNLRAHLQELERTGQIAQVTPQLHNDVFVQRFLSDSTGKFWTWINDRKQRLGEARRKYETAEVYPQ